jgi:hypothetical protein
LNKPFTVNLPPSRFEAVDRPGNTNAAELEPRKKSLPPVTTIAGGAVRLFEADEELGIAEGMTTFSAPLPGRVWNRVWDRPQREREMQAVLRVLGMKMADGSSAT